MQSSPAVALKPVETFTSRVAKWPVVVLLLALVFGYGGVRLLTANARLLTLRQDVTYPESTDIQLALWTAQTGRILPHFHSPPFTPAIYGPGFYLLLAAAARQFHAGFFPLLVAARAAAYGGFIGLLALIFIYLRRGRALGWLPAVAAVAALAATADFSLWIASARPDLPALLLTIAGLLLAAWPPPAWLAPPPGCSNNRLLPLLWLCCLACCSGAAGVMRAFLLPPVS